jgi:hypothetical protein
MVDAVPLCVVLLTPGGHVGALVEALAERGSDCAYTLPIPMSKGKLRDVGATPGSFERRPIPVSQLVGLSLPHPSPTPQPRPPLRTHTHTLTPPLCPPPLLSLPRPRPHALIPCLCPPGAVLLLLWPQDGRRVLV